MSRITVGETRNILDDNSMTFDERQKELDTQKKAEEEARKRARNSPYRRWAQINLDTSKHIDRLVEEYPKAYRVLNFLVDNMDNYNAVMCSYQVLQEALNLSHATIARCVKVLKERGFIVILKSGTSNVYCVNDDIFWKSWGNKKQYSKFPANVVLSATEQEKEVQLEIQRHKEIKLKDGEEGDVSEV